MQYRPFGQLGYEVSLLGMGCMRLPRIEAGPAAGEVDRDKTFQLIRYAADHGINYFDTAYAYHSFKGENILGEALAQGYRKKVKIATKQPYAIMKTQDDIRRNLENTLVKMGTDYLDVYLIHAIDWRRWEEMKQRGIVETFIRFKEEGLIRAFGFSYHGDPEPFRDIFHAYPWDMCQFQQNLFDTDKEVTAEAIDEVGRAGAALVIMEPLRGGGLANAPRTVKAVYDSWEEKRAPAHWAFRHLINYPQISCILSGMSTLDQLKENISIFSRSDSVAGCLSSGEKDILQKAKAAYEGEDSIACTGCEYCMPCPKKVDIPRVFSLYNEGINFERFDKSRRLYYIKLVRSGADVSQCIGCGACETKCPQRIDIIAKLKTARTALAGWTE